MRVKIITAALLCITVIFFAASVSGEESKESLKADKQYRIVFSTFDRSSAGKYSELRDSVQTMLASRLAAIDGVDVLDKTFTDKELSAIKRKSPRQDLSLGGLNADYLVTGSLFSLTSGLEIQVELYPLVSKDKVLHFSVHCKTPDTLITDVEQLSKTIGGQAFGDKRSSVTEEKKEGEAGGNAGFITAHPEEAYKRNAYVGSVVGVAGSGVTAKGVGARLTKRLPFDARLMAVGDITGDGERKILLLTGSQLRLFTSKGEDIRKIAETSLPPNLVVHAINLADLDGDGQEEIYLSGTDGLYVSSMILQYDAAGGFPVISRNIPWYLRPLFVPGKGWQLAGQKRGVKRIDLISPGVYLLALDKQYTITQGDRLALPPSVNLFDFVYADLDGDGFYELVAVDQKEKLRVYSPSNELMWVSQKNFGASKIYLGPSQGGATSETSRRNFTVEENSERELIFVPGRILVTDIDQDGKQDLVISESEKAGIGNYFRRLRFYEDGALVGLSWNKSTLTEMWRTGNFRGYLAGYDFSLLAKQAQQGQMKTEDEHKTIGKLIVGSLPKSGSLLDLLPGQGETELSIYDLEFTFTNSQAKDKQ